MSPVLKRKVMVVCIIFVWLVSTTFFSFPIKEYNVPTVYADYVSYDDQGYFELKFASNSQ